MIKPYKMEKRYFVADCEDVRKETRGFLGMDQATWVYLNILEWFEDQWDPQEIDHNWFTRASREVTWLEVLVATGRSKRQSIETYEDSFNEPGKRLFG